MSGSTAGHIVQAESIGQVHFHGRPDYPVPSQLPPPSGIFASRRHELAKLDGWATDDAALPLFVVINGPGGVGKTTLAVRWLHDVRKRFPGGQLYANLGAFSSGPPATPEEVLEWFLVALGVPNDRVPHGLPQREALYRSLTADLAIAVLLDDALSVAQVRPLLPASHRGLVAVTSRWRLSGLRASGARFVEAGPMNVADSVELLNRLLADERPAREHGQAEEIARLCGGMPIALSVIGARLVAHPKRPLAREVGNLRGRDRLTRLSAGTEMSVEAVFDMSYQELAGDPELVYRRGALHPGETFGVDVLAAAVDLSSHETEQALDVLVERNLLTEIDDRRFRYHDLLLVHATRQGERVDGQADRDTALRSMIEWYLDVTVVADLVLRPTRRRVGPRFAEDGRRPVAFESREDAMEWLEREHRNLLLAATAAHEHGWYALVWEFCEALWGYYLYARRYDEWLALHEIGIPAARRDGNPLAEARTRIQYGSALVGLGRHAEARREHEVALDLAERAGDEFTVATALSEVAGAAQGDGDLTGALDHLYRARAIRDVIGTPRAVALCRRRIGEVLAQLGRTDEAMVELSAAATAMGDLGDPAQQARALISLGVVHAERCDPAAATDVLTMALDLATQAGSPHYRADALAALGDVAAHAGDHPAARATLTEALAIYADSGDPKAEIVTRRLAAMPPE
jgi:tetratricopeptide (TPR) repeat protein